MLRFQHEFAAAPGLSAVADDTNQEGRLELSLLHEAVRPQLEVGESLPSVLRELAHLAVCVRGRGSCP